MKKIIVLFLMTALSLCAQAAASFIVGDAFTLNATTTGGTQPFTYVWFKNNVVWPGMVSDHIDFTNCQTYDAGTFRVEISNSAGKSVSPDFVVAIAPKPIPVAAPVGAAINAVKKSP